MKSDLFPMIKRLHTRTEEYIRDLNDNNKYYEILCNEKAFLLYINKDSILKSLVTHAIWLALMDMMNIISWNNYEDVIRTWSIFHITVVTAPYPQKKNRPHSHSPLIKVWRYLRTDLFHKIHMKNNEIVLFFNEK